MREVRDELLRSTIKHDREHAEKLNEEYIRLWEELHACNVGNRSPGDLSVCYLAGPEPMNDFRILVGLGVHPNNIWAFESDKGIYSDALAEVAVSEFPLLKLYRGSIEDFFVNSPKRFDIIYIDACGPMPSVAQRTLGIISTAMRYQRIASPGALITNFASPSTGNAESKDNHAYLVSNYLYPKCFIEGYPESVSAPGVSEGPFFQSYAPLKSGELDGFLETVTSNLDDYYGQYVTRQLMDLASFVIPWHRFCNSNYWRDFFNVAPRDLPEIIERMESSHDFDGNDVYDVENYLHRIAGSVAEELNEHAFHWTLCAAGERGSTHLGDRAFPTPPLSFAKLRNTWLNELGGKPQSTFDVQTALKCHNLLQMNSELWSERLQSSIGNFEFGREMFQFCDVPMSNLGFDLLTNQLSYPMHYSTHAIKRWKYTAKSTPMFLDAIIFDECRYIYDWLPSLDLLSHGFKDVGQQLAYRFALDGLNKTRRWYNEEYFTGTAVIDQYRPGFQAQFLSQRQVIH